jgi:hypothetical protein
MLAIALMLLVYFFYTGEAFISVLLPQDRLYYWIATAAWLVLFSILLSRHGHTWNRVEQRVERRVYELVPRWFRLALTDRRVVALAFLAIGTAFLIAAGRTIVHTPLIVTNSGDMLPLIEQAVGNFLHGINPYRGYRISQEIHLTYLPGLWLTYIPAQLAGVDYRWTGVAAELAVLAIWWRWTDRTLAHLADAQIQTRLTFTIQSIALPAIFFLSAGQRWFIPSMHTPPWWFWLSLFLFSAATGRDSRASLALGLCCASRQTAFVLVPIWLIYLWGHRRGTFAKDVALWAAPVAILILPFFVWNPGQFVFGTVRWYQISSAMSWNFLAEGNAKTFGITGMLYALGLLRYSTAVQLVGLLVIFVIAIRRISDIGDAFVLMCWSLLWFSMTAFVPYHYLYLPVFLLVSLTILNRWTENSGRAA